MSWFDVIGIMLQFIPFISRFGRWLLERNMEVMILPLKVWNGRLSLEPAIQVNSRVINDKPYVTIGAVFNLRLINHRTDRSERIIGCSLDLKKQYWLYWNKVIFSVPISGKGNTNYFNNLELKPLSASTDIEIEYYQTLPIQKISHRVKLILKFKMVGPMRKKEILLGTF